MVLSSVCLANRRASQFASMTNVDGLLSTRGGLNVTQVLGRIPSHVLNPALHRDEIDLSMAENQVIRHEIIQLAKVAIETSLYYEVANHPAAYPTGRLDAC